MKPLKWLVESNIPEWEKLNFDMVILDMLKGYHIKFKSAELPKQQSDPFSIKISNWEKIIMNQEIEKLLEIGVLQLRDRPLPRRFFIQCFSFEKESRRMPESSNAA